MSSPVAIEQTTIEHQTTVHDLSFPCPYCGHAQSLTLYTPVDPRATHTCTECDQTYTLNPITEYTRSVPSPDAQADRIQSHLERMVAVHDLGCADSSTFVPGVYLGLRFGLMGLLIGVMPLYFLNLLNALSTPLPTLTPPVSITAGDLIFLTGAAFTAIVATLLFERVTRQYRTTASADTIDRAPVLTNNHLDIYLHARKTSDTLPWWYPYSR